MKKQNLSLGQLGEQIASRYLSHRGFKLIEKNFKKRYGEIDLICIDSKTLVFIEVKTRRSGKFGGSKEAITPWKLRSLKNAAYYYKLKHPELPDSLRIDVVCLTLDFQNNPISIEHIPNITL